MKSSIIALALSFVAFVSAPAATYTLSGPMDVFQATTNPANSGNGSGTITGDYDDVTNTLNYTLTWENLSGSISNAHFHLGGPGTPGGVQLGIPGPWTSPYSRSETISDGLEANLLAGDWYVNIHTSAFGGGEIRGQVLVTEIPEPSGAALLLAGAAAVGLRRRRR